MKNALKGLIYFWSALVVFAGTFGMTHAAGGGGGGGGGSGGGGVPLCTQDTWTCESWGECSVQGQQVRDCTFTRDCAGVDTPKPVETRSCTPPCTEDTWTCSDWNRCSDDGKQARKCDLTLDCPAVETAKPMTRQACTPPAKAEVKTETKKSTPTPAPLVPKATPASCKVDVYSCTDWGSCEEDGNTRRSCQKTKDCATADNPPPAQEQACPGLRCGHLKTLEERVLCRLKLTAEERKNEWSILYFPEYCRVEETAEEKAECIDLYRSFKSCWDMPPGPARQVCGREKTGMTFFGTERAACAQKQGPERTECLNELKEKMEHWALFNMYELEFQAEALQKAGRVSLDAVAALDVYVEQKKAELDRSESLQGWKKILLETKIYWQQFLNQNVR